MTDRHSTHTHTHTHTHHTHTHKYTYKQTDSQAGIQMGRQADIFTHRQLITSLASAELKHSSTASAYRKLTYRQHQRRVKICSKASKPVEPRVSLRYLPSTHELHFATGLAASIQTSHHKQLSSASWGLRLWPLFAMCARVRMCHVPGCMNTIPGVMPMHEKSQGKAPPKVLSALT